MIADLKMHHIYLLEPTVKHPYAMSLRFDQIVLLDLFQVDYFTNGGLAAQIVDLSHFVLVWYFRVSRWYYLVLFEGFVFVARFFDHADVLDYVLSELWPLEMAVPIDVDRLEKFNQVRHEEIFRHLMVGNVQFFDQVNESG